MCVIEVDVGFFSSQDTVPIEPSNDLTIYMIEL